MKNYTTKAMIDRLVRECDRLWRRAVLMEAGCKCQICGAPETSEKGKLIWVQACHIITREYWSTRWDPRNGIAGCQDCHDHVTIMEWLKKMDRKRYNWIILQKQKQVSHRDIDLEKVLRKLRSVA